MENMQDVNELSTGEQFVRDNPLHALMVKMHREAKEKGFWDSNRSFGESIALIHSELSEALEEDRAGKPDLYTNDGSVKPEGVAIELVDALIRIMDLLGSRKIGMATGLTLDELVDLKFSYNQGRAAKHGRL